jgi:hypothetical protein
MIQWRWNFSPQSSPWKAPGGKTTRMVQCEPDSQFLLSYISSGEIIGVWLTMFTKRLR